ncbi:MAG: exo-alpha-sialidase [Candidatus Eisenbacteria bacterium]|nr:exo-alpha-sialidase [Candidatus Eisenbacteria bacterium]
MRARFTRAALISCFALAWAAGAHAQEDFWSGTVADQVISFDDNEYARAVQVLASPSGLHAVWSEDAPSIREIHYGRSSDGGTTWTSETADRVISFPDNHGVNPEECDIAGDGEDFLIVVWSEDVDATQEVHYGISTDGGSTWSSETADLVLSDPASAADTQSPSVAIDFDGVLHVVWNQPAAGGTSEVHYSRSTDGGVSWSGAVADRFVSFPDGNNVVSPQITRDSENRLIVAWREIGDAGTATIHAGVSTDGGLTWSSEGADYEISQAASLITNLAIAAEPCYDIGVHVVYTASFDLQAPYHYEVYATSSYDGGAHWSGQDGLVPVSHDEGEGRSASNPDLFVGVSQGAIAVWDEEEDAGGTKEQHISYGPESWSGAGADEIVSFPDGEDGYRPSISGFTCMVTVPGDPGPRDFVDDTFVLWTEFTGGAIDNYEVHLSSIQLVTSAVEDETSSFGGAGLAVFPNPSSGGVHLLWKGYGAGLPAGAEIEVYDASGRLVRRLSLAGGETVVWDRKDGGGRDVRPGVYFTRLRSLSCAASRGTPIVLQ